MNAGMGRMSALGANWKRRDGGYDVNDPKADINQSTMHWAAGHIVLAPQNVRVHQDLAFPGWTAGNLLARSDMVTSSLIV